MKISEFIAKLDEFRKIHGDVEIAVPNSDGSIVSPTIHHDAFFNAVVVSTGLHDEDTFDNGDGDSDSFEADPPDLGGSY